MKQIRRILTLGAAVFMPLLPAFGQGSIVYVDTPDITMGAFDGETFSFDLDGNGTMDVDFRNRSGDFRVLPRAGNEVAAVAATPPLAGGNTTPLAKGALVSFSLSWQTRYPSFPLGQFEGPLLSTTVGSVSAYGPFAGVDGYLGIRFLIGSELHYGWIHLNCVFSGPYQPAAGRITEWAYNSVADQPITVGAVPEPGVATLLAIGGGTILLFRRLKA